MIEHLLWAKDGDRRLGTRNAYEVASAFVNSQTGHSGLLGQSCLSESWPVCWASAEGLLLWYSPLIRATLLSVTPPPLPVGPTCARDTAMPSAL